jgi:hypothetical protein
MESTAHNQYLLFRANRSDSDGAPARACPELAEGNLLFAGTFPHVWSGHSCPLLLTLILILILTFADACTAHATSCKSAASARPE